MKIQQQLILIAGIVYFGLISAQPNDQTSDQATTGKVEDKGKIQKNFQNLFKAIARNDAGRSEIHSGILNKEVMRERQTFDTMKEELQIARDQNAYKKRNFYHGRNNVDENFVPVKRETNDNSIKTRLDGAIVSLTAKLNGLRTGRVSASILEPVKVNVYGASMSINQLGTISVADPKLITVQVWDTSHMADIEKAILTSGLGLNPSTDGNVIRIPVPALTEERRKELSKKCTEYGENAKVAVRNVRRDALDALKKRGKDKELSQDELKDETEKMKKFADGYITQVDDLVERKSKEIMSG